MTEYNKLVRDRIPEIIKKNGDRPVIRILPVDEYRLKLERKLDEEVAEYHRDQNMEELADILEVVFALNESLGHTRQELVDTCQRKREARGGFSDRIFLICKE